MTSISQRVERLERNTTTTRPPRIFMIEGPDSYGIDQALAELGIDELVNDDLVLYVCGRGDDVPLRRRYEPRPAILYTSSRGLTDAGSEEPEA